MPATRNEATLFLINASLRICESRIIARQLGLQYACFHSSEEFLRSFIPRQPGCLLISSASPGEEGLALQQDLSGRDPSLPVILYGESVDVGFVVRALRSGVFTVVQRTRDSQLIQEEIVNALRFNRAAHLGSSRRAELESRFQKPDDRESEVMKLVLAGLPNKAITNRLDISLRTLNRIRGEILRKANVRTVLELAQCATEWSATKRAA